jgi:hypothetical protein
MQTRRRPNPAPGKDAEIEMEPLTPTGTAPNTLPIGRLFHQDIGVAAALLARQRLLSERGSTRRALVASNPCGHLPLMETFSRNTAKELRNSGYGTTARFGKEVDPREMRHLLPEQDIFRWEGRYKTLMEQFGLASWDEPLRPSLVFPQSCLALNEREARPLLERGAVGVVGSSTRTYSATGGALTLCFFDALLYEDQSLGGALRQAKNFLLAYSLLKEKRLGAAARRTGVNVRSAWAFTLWGDPTLKLPRPERPQDALPAVRHQVDGNTTTVTLPDTLYDAVTVKQYQARMIPNARLAGLLTDVEGEPGNRRLVPFLFIEVALPHVPAGKTPRLQSQLPEKNWVFCWDGRRQSGYLLITPRGKSERQVRFQVD